MMMMMMSMLLDLMVDLTVSRSRRASRCVYTCLCVFVCACVCMCDHQTYSMVNCIHTSILFRLVCWLAIYLINIIKWYGIVRWWSYVCYHIPHLSKWINKQTNKQTHKQSNHSFSKMDFTLMTIINLVDYN